MFHYKRKTPKSIPEKENHNIFFFTKKHHLQDIGNFMLFVHDWIWHWICIQSKIVSWEKKIKIEIDSDSIYRIFFSDISFTHTHIKIHTNIAINLDKLPNCLKIFKFFSFFLKQTKKSIERKVWSLDFSFENL